MSVTRLPYQRHFYFPDIAPGALLEYCAAPPALCSCCSGVGAHPASMLTPIGMIVIFEPCHSCAGSGITHRSLPS